MDLSKCLRPELILLRPKVDDKWQLLEKMVAAVAEGPFSRDIPEQVRPELLKGVLVRERDRSTGLGQGFALPHTRFPGLRRFQMCLAILPEGIEYEAPDDQPVQVVCLVITPQENPTIALKVMAAVTKFLSDEAVRHYFLEVADSQRAYDYIRQRRPSVDLSVTARDIMRLPRAQALADQPLPQVTRAMLDAGVDSVPVVDSENKVIGEITCDSLFKQGVPDFFGQLSSVSFIRHFDPFERYFSHEVVACAKDAMSRNFCAMQEDATLLEVVFALSVKRYGKIYVVRDGKLVGIIDRIAVLDRILNL